MSLAFSISQHIISEEDPHPALQDVMKRVSVKVHEILLDTQNIHELHKLGVTQDPQVRTIHPLPEHLFKIPFRLLIMASWSVSSMLYELKWF